MLRENNQTNDSAEIENLTTLQQVEWLNEVIEYLQKSKSM